jgi:hypothetical protein
MNDFLKILIDGIMDALEEFFDALIVPTQRYTLDAFFVSLIFLAWSVVAKIFELSTFVDWQEALTCVILLGIITLIDSSTRSSITSSLTKVKGVATRFTYSNEDVEEDSMEEVIEDESGQQ